MAWIDDYRKANPWADKYSDADIVKYEAGEAGVDPQSFAKSIGIAQHTGNAGDFVTDIKRGIQKIPGAVTGMLDIPVAMVTGRPMVSEGWDAIGDVTGFKPGRWADDATLQYSPGRQQARQEIENAWDKGSAADIAGAYVTNPAATFGTVLESAPSMVGGGVLGRGLSVAGRGAPLARGVAGPVQPGYLARVAGERAPYLAAAAGEGAFTAGQTMDQLEKAGVDPRRAAAASLAAGAGTGALGYVGGRVANRLGMGDLETSIVGGIEHAPGTVPSLPKRVAGGAFSEGVLEELPQSMQEQVWQNWAEGKPLTEGVGRAGVEGMLAGGFMGGGVNLRPAPKAPVTPNATTDLLDTPQYDLVTDPAPLQDRINQNLGIGRGLSVPRAEVKDAFNAPIDPTIVMGPDGKPFSTTKAGDLYDFQNRERIADQTYRRGAQDLLGDPLYTPLPVQEQAPVEEAPAVNRRQGQLNFDVPSRPEVIYGNQYNPASPVGPNGVETNNQAGAFTQLPITDAIRQAPNARQQSETELAGVRTVKSLKAAADNALAQNLITPDQHVSFFNEIDTNRKLNLAKKRELLTGLIQGNRNGNQENVARGQEGNGQAGQSQSTFPSRENGIAQGNEARGGTQAQVGRQGTQGLLNGAETTQAVQAETQGSQAPVAVPAGQSVNAAQPQQVVAQAPEASAEKVAPVTRRAARSVARDVEALGGNTKKVELKREASRLYNNLMVEGNDAQIDEAEAFLAANAKKPTREGTKDFRSASSRDKAIIYDRLGWDEEGNAVGEPMTEEAIAEKHGLTAARINQILIDNGITNEVVDRAVATDAGVANEASQELANTGQVTPINSAGGSQGAVGGKGKKIKQSKPPKAEIEQMTDDDLQETLIEASKSDPAKLSDHWAYKELSKRFKTREQQDDQISEESETTDELDGDLSDWDARFAKGNVAQNPTTVEKITNEIQKLFFTKSRFSNKVTVVATADDLPPDALRFSQTDANTMAFVLPNGRAYMIADRIEQGEELAIFLHEVGVHLGLEKLLGGKENFLRLAQQIVKWYDRNDNSPESRIAKLALGRVTSAARNTENFGDTDYMHETVAYFVEEAVMAGFNPTAAGEVSNGVNAWLKTLWDSIKRALKAFGIDRLDTLTAQDVVDLAAAAAHMNMVGRNTESEVGRAVRFSKSADATTAEGFFSKLGGMLDDVLANPKGWVKQHGLGWMTLEQIADTMKSKAVEAYVGVMNKMQQFAKERVYDAAQIDIDWAKLSDNVQERLSEVMRDATRAGFDPAVRTDAATTYEQQELRRKYNALPAEAQKIYTRVRDYYASNLEARKAIMMEAANKARNEGKNVSEVERMFSQVKGPYFPLMRIGGWYSVGMSDAMADLQAKVEDKTATEEEIAQYNKMRTDPKHYSTSGHMSRREAKRAAEEMRQRLGNAHFNVAETRINKELAKVPDLAVLEQYMATDLPNVTRSEIKDMLAQMYFDMMPENSALKRMMRREGVHGEEKDMRRVFAASAISQAHHISRMKYANELSETMVNVRKEGRRDEMKRMIANELDKRTELAMQKDDNPVVERLLQGSYFAHLGLSPAFLLTNMTQVPMITAPWLGARYGLGKTSAALASATADAINIIRGTYKDNDWRAEFDWNTVYPKGSPEDRLMQSLLDRNILDITIEHDLGSVVKMRNNKLDDAIKIANLPVRVTETANRLVTGLAAYRLAVEKGMPHDDAVDHAAKAISETQLNYSGLNAPRHMQSVLGSKAIAKLMFQFRKYQQGMVYLVVKNAKEALSSVDSQERKEARRTLFGLMATTGLMAGATGMPFAGSIFWLATMLGGIGGDDDEPFDAEVDFRNFLADTFGEEIGLAMSKGLPTLFNVDLSNNVGMGNIGMPLPYIRNGNKPSETMQNALAASAGAAFGTIADTLDGMALLMDGDFGKGAEKIVPVKAAKSLIKAYGMADQGMVNTRGEVILPGESFSPWDIALRAAGFTTATESEYYDANNAVESARRAASETRTKLLREYAQARLSGADTSDFQAKVEDFNTRHPEKGVRIDQSALIKAVEERRKMAASRTESGLKQDKRTAPYLERARFNAQ